MTMTEPIVDPQWGSGDWVDYVNNWREKDAEWLQSRSILRYHNAADRQEDLGAAPPIGQTTYNEFTDRLEMFSKQQNAWATLLSVRYLAITQDSPSGFAISHVNAGGAGIVLTPTLTVLDKKTSLMGVATVDTDGLTIKTGTGIASRMSTDATSMVFSTPITVPGLTFIGGGGINAPGQSVTFGTVTAGQGNFTNINLTGTLTGGVINGIRGTIGGVGLGTIGNAIVDADWHIGNNGAFYGNSNSAVMRQRNYSDGALGRAYVQVYENSVNFYGAASVADFWAQPRVRDGQSIQFYHPNNSLLSNCGGVVYSTGNLAAANYPAGTIWVS